MTIGSAADLSALQRVGRVVALTLDEMRQAVRPGITTGALDAVAARFARALGARSGPQLAYDFPGFTCISVNDEIVHGVPGARVIEPGDVVKLDVTLELDGYVADSAITVLVPPVAEQSRRLQRAARAAFNQGLRAARAGETLSSVGRAVERSVERDGFAVLRELTGHGVGRHVHESPAVPNFDDPRSHQRLREGLVIALEPLIATMPARISEDADGWTLRTHNRALAAHHEHTIVIRQGEPLVLTAA